MIRSECFVFFCHRSITTQAQPFYHTKKYISFFLNILFSMVKKMKRTFSFADAMPKRNNLISNPCAACNTFAGYFSSCLRFNISIPKNCSATPAKELQLPSALNHTSQRTLSHNRCNAKAV